VKSFRVHVLRRFGRILETGIRTSVRLGFIFCFELNVLEAFAVRQPDRWCLQDGRPGEK